MDFGSVWIRTHPVPLRPKSCVLVLDQGFQGPPHPLCLSLQGIRATGQCQGHSLLQEITSDTGRQRVAQISSCPPVGTGCSSHSSFSDDSATAQTSRRPYVDLRDCAFSCPMPPVLAASLSHRVGGRDHPLSQPGSRWPTSGTIHHLRTGPAYASPQSLSTLTHKSRNGLFML